MIEVNSCTFKGKEYIEVDRIENNGKIYAYLVNEKDEQDFMVRIVRKEENQEIYDPLANKAEFEKALAIFLKKNISENK